MSTIGLLSPPNAHAVAVMLLTGFALVLFTRERIALETSCLFVLVVLVLGFEIFPFVLTVSVKPIEAFGFSQIVTISND